MHGHRFTILLTIALGLGALAVLGPIALAGSGSLENDGTLDFEFNFRFPPTPAQVEMVKEQIRRASQILCDATEGQVRIETVRLTGGAADEDRADFWYFAESFRSGLSFFLDGSNLGTLGRHVNLGQGGIRADVIAHELGHHAFGLGDQYDEQRRFGGPCGIGRGFESMDVDEQNHSIMQQSGAQICVAGGNGCFTDADCAAGDTCAPVLMSELSTPANHDSLQGDGVVCPEPRPTTEMILTARLSSADVVEMFDPSSFDTADDTSQLVRDTEVIDSKGEVDGRFAGPSAHRLKSYFEHTGAGAWTVHFGIDDGDIDGGTEGELRILQSVEMTFQPDGSLDTLDPADPVVTIEDLASGADDMMIDVTLDVFESAASSRFFNPSRALDGLPLCPADDCSERWNSMTDRYESTQQTLAHDGESDWETLEDNYGFLSAPAGLPAAAPPTTCNQPIEFVDDVVGSDQVMLIVDRSGSMLSPVKDGSDQSRLDFAKAAARAFVDLQAGGGVDLGILSFNDLTSLDRFFEGEGDELDPGEAEPVKEIVDDLMSGGATGIGTALTSSISEFQRVEDESRIRTAFLLSDGENNRGEDPNEAAQRLKDMGIRVFTIPVGSAADRDLLSEVAGETGAVMLDAPRGDELPPIYAELYARARGEGLALPRTASAVAGVIESAGGEERTQQAPPFETFTIPVEGGSNQLNVMLSARNLDVTSWNPAFELRGPGGELITDADQRYVTYDEYYRIVEVDAPTPGDWQLEVSARSVAVEESFVLAHSENPRPDCLVDVTPRIAGGGEPVTVSAKASYGTELEGVEYRGAVRRPDGVIVPLEFEDTTRTGIVAAGFEDFAGFGVYEVRVVCSVGEETRYREGESIFEGSPTPSAEIEPFERAARTSFYLRVPVAPDCFTADCDEDGIPNGEDGMMDVDGDGLGAFLDDDADGDDIPDAVEGTVDTDGDGVPDYLDEDSDGDGIEDLEEGLADLDEDGIPNYNDLDSDGDGIPDEEDPFPFEPCDVNDDVAPVVTLASTRQIVVPHPNAPASDYFESSDDDGFGGGVVHERIILAGCVAYDGQADGDGDGLLSDETAILTPAELCRIAAKCNFPPVLRTPTLTVEATDCNGNVGSASKTSRSDVKLRPGLCGP